MRALALALLLAPGAGLAEGLAVADAHVPLAPPGARVHAAYMTLTNPGGTERRVVGVRAEGYGMAHLHVSEIRDGVATMSAVDMVTLAPGQSVTLGPGGLHVMLMQPEAPLAPGGTVGLVLDFADGATQRVAAQVVGRQAGSHGSHGS